MIDARVLATYKADSTLEVWGYWIPRRGDNARLVVEVTANYQTEMTATVYAKNYSDPGDGSSTGQSVQFGGGVVGRKTIELLGASELIRFKVSLDKAVDIPDGKVGWVMFRFLHPTWFESVKV